MGVPVVTPSYTPDRISTASRSLRCVTWREVPGRRGSNSGWMSASDRAMPGGHPSITQPMAGPCDSPKLVTRNRVPKVLPDMGESRPGKESHFTPGRIEPLGSMSELQEGELLLWQQQRVESPHLGPREGYP